MKPKGTLVKKKPQERTVLNPRREVLTEQMGPVTKSRHGLYAHNCYEWDEMLIDETDPEFDVCNCGKPNTKT